MKILVYTPSFYPKVGGLETVNYLIVQGLAEHYDVTVITPVLDVDDDHLYQCKVIRTTSKLILLKEYFKCDVFIHSVLSLKGLFPLFLFPKKWIVIHHTCYFRVWNQGETFSSRLKSFFSYFSHNICVSNAVGKNLGLKKYAVIHNSFDTTLFRNYKMGQRSGFVFVGRLVSEKGIGLLIEAYLKYLLASSKKQKLFIIGDGPMMQEYKMLISKYDMDEQIFLLGQLRGEKLVGELNQRYCMIVPSFYKEAFGIVALEGLACGCQVIGSDSDGISEAIGTCGLLFEKGNSEDLASKMLKMDSMKPLKDEIVFNYLKKFTPESMVQKYLDYLKYEKENNYISSHRK